MKNNNLIIIVIILFTLYYFFSSKEGYSNTNETSDEKSNETTKLCSQKAINDAYNLWTFGSPKFVR
jgi:uncharacterized protein YpmB